MPTQRVSEARQILEYSREIAERVVAGETYLVEALEEVSKSQGAARNERIRKAKLSKARPDLAELVDTETRNKTGK